ncbi:MAG: NAD(P)H-hydrate dehydratase, partial [Planctomycetota bacterium]
PDDAPLVPLELPHLPARAADSHKGSYGSVLIVAGSRRYPGAAILAALGAGRAGAGLVRLAMPAGIVPAVVPAAAFATSRPCPETAGGGLDHTALAEILDEAGTCTSAVVGPGLGQDEQTGRLLADLLPALEVPLVLDADGLNLLVRLGLDTLAARKAPTILTPHPGEFARLAGSETPQGEARAPAAAALARRTGAIVVLKGHGTVVTDGRRARTETAGNPGMATGGTGDVLAGALGALLAVVPDPAQAAALAVHLHARAGDAAAAEGGQDALLPEDVARHLGAALAACRASG